MLTGNYTFNKESFTLFDSEQLADTINHDIKKMPIAQMCLVTHNYDILFIEKVLDAIELQADIDRFAGILKICWKIDVANNRMEVVRLNTETKLYEPYHPQFENKVDAIVEKIVSIAVKLLLPFSIAIRCDRVLRQILRLFSLFFFLIPFPLLLLRFPLIHLPLFYLPQIRR